MLLSFPDEDTNLQIILYNIHERGKNMGFYRFDLYSDVLGRDEDIFIAAPAKMDDDTRVVYLLHGGGGGGGVDNTSWLPQKQRLENWAETFKTVFIMPSAPDSFFANTCNGIRYQDYMLDELTVLIPEIFRVSDKRLRTAVAGMSMGGTSAFRLGMAAPEKFGAIGCLSSGNLWLSPLSNRVHAYAVKNVFGVERIEDIQGTEYDFFVDAMRNIREGRPLPHIFHACGKEDHALEHAHMTSEWIKKNLPEYDYNYFEPDVGRHDDAFWAEWMPKFLDFFTGLDRE